MFELSPPWIAAIGTIFGGAGLKLIESYLNRPSKKDSTPAEIRDELRKEIISLKADLSAMKIEIDKTEAEMLEWREKYWALVEQHVKIKQQLLDYLSELERLRVTNKVQPKGEEHVS